MLNFKLSEFLHSDTAIQKRIINMPDINSMDCLLDLIFYVMQPLRAKLGKPISITSGYRCLELNKTVGGNLKSQHCKGQACDFVVRGMSVQQVFKFIQQSGIEYDQLILEKVGCVEWVHVSFDFGNNRKQCLQFDGKKYTSI